MKLPIRDRQMQPTDPLTQRYEILRKMFVDGGIGKTEAGQRAAVIACMNRRERRRFLGHRGPKRGLPRLMKVPRR